MLRYRLPPSTSSLNQDNNLELGLSSIPGLWCPIHEPLLKLLSLCSATSVGSMTQHSPGCMQCSKTCLQQLETKPTNKMMLINFFAQLLKDSALLLLNIEDFGTETVYWRKKGTIFKDFIF